MDLIEHKDFQTALKDINTRKLLPKRASPNIKILDLSSDGDDNGLELF